MSKKIDRRLLDANAMVMGGGVGLAALESMFNLVQTQSLLSASMVRDHDLSYGLSLEALALALNEVLDPGVNRSNRTCSRCSGAVRVDIPTGPVVGTSTSNGAAASADDGARRGALANADVLSGLASESEQSTTQTSETSASMEKLLTQIFDLLGGHMTELNDGYRESNRRHLMVT